MRALVSREFTLATADDLDGTVDNTQAANVTGAASVLIFQVNNGTAGTAGIDVIEVSHDGGKTWGTDAADANPSLMAIDGNPVTGTILASSALNAAGVEPTLYAGFKMGPFNGPTAIRCARVTTTTNGTTWVTGSPTVKCVAVGIGATISALA